ncbi:DNA replication/repair protein RecF [Methylocystis bryophila]|uniref:DNA replication and repair protein RecF n=1 Tax=Methylocystis bryophila TaxID=655015 RepID=A0A1W6MUR5_9HYPH|nr:DNA replication/repair protein RecF [Methylocystis bryophila]ARN81334.1 DNA replication/repair protein RecF [Methylocystis bryophila]BDV37317.1 DNA replication and repair protein RecF [Methylocystis bryophila]
MSSSDPRKSARRPQIRRLMLRDFRSYESLDIRLGARLIALTGENGAGKTNLLEALSMFSPGRGLRRADAEDCARKEGSGGFSVSIELQTDGHVAQLGHGFEPGEGRRFRMDRLPASSARGFADRLQVVWLTPAMDGLFAGPAGDRRRFIDRLTLGVDPEHGARVSKFEQALRGRNRLLDDGGSETRWLAAAEQEIAALGVAVASARLETVQRLQALIDSTRVETSAFPDAVIALQGDLEALLLEHPAIAVEERYREMLDQSRRRDAAAGRALVGPQTSDLLARHGPKDAPARDCSTGEQKALLVGLVLAQAQLLANLRGAAPLVLLDEIAAHFDVKRREALFNELERLGSQVFMSGADPVLFAPLQGRAEIFLVTPGRVEALS